MSELSGGVGWSVETGNDGVDSSLVRERVYCLVEAVVGQGQSTTILLITLEVANSKAKSYK